MRHLPVPACRILAMFDRQFQALWSPASVELHVEQQLQDRAANEPSQSLKFYKLKLILDKRLEALFKTLLRH